MKSKQKLLFDHNQIDKHRHLNLIVYIDIVTGVWYEPNLQNVIQLLDQPYFIQNKYALRWSPAPPRQTLLYFHPLEKLDQS